jgi:hypothetical protein
VQDVECRQPHTTKVSTITHDDSYAPDPLEADSQPLADPQAAIQSGRESMREALRRSASALKADGVPFALAGSYALWVHGAPEGDHDVDLAVAEDDVEAAVVSLATAGFTIERPPEDWLFKAWWEGVLVDVLHRLVGDPVDRDRLAGAAEHDVLGVRMPVLPPTDIVITKLLSLTEQYCDFTALLPYARAVREKLDWERVRAATEDQPYAAAFVYLLDRLGVSG